MIRRLLLLVFIVALLVPLAANAQDRGEISAFGGFSGLAELFDTNYGWNASVAGNVTRHLALVADLSGYYGSGTKGWFSSPVDHAYGLLFGPRYVHTIGERWTPFVHAMLGPYQEAGNSIGFSGSGSRNLLALVLGAGLDIRANSRISIRALQLDMMRVRNRNYDDARGRVSFGVVFHLAGIHK
jgi:hypothetical protein